MTQQHVQQHVAKGNTASGGMSRRSFLKLSAALGISLAAPSVMGNGAAAAADNGYSYRGACISGQRVLGTGTHSLTVSPIGFGISQSHCHCVQIWS